MSTKPAPRKAAGIADAAVHAKTGKTWAEWFALLDKAGAAKWDHKTIAKYIHDKLGCPPWWGQMVTVGYEQERGLREKHQKPDGYSISASKTIAVPLKRLYQAWDEEKVRNDWLGEKQLTIRKATVNRSVRITWKDGKTIVEVMFYSKGTAKSQVTVQHNKLADMKAGERMKAYWSKKLEALKKLLESVT